MYIYQRIGIRELGIGFVVNWDEVSGQLMTDLVINWEYTGLNIESASDLNAYELTLVGNIVPGFYV